MQTLYDTCQRYENIEYFNEWFATSIIHDGQRFLGITAIELSSGTFYTIKVAFHKIQLYQMHMLL